MVKAGAIPLAVKLLSTGTDPCKEASTAFLHALATRTDPNDARKVCSCAPSQGGEKYTVNHPAFPVPFFRVNIQAYKSPCGGAHSCKSVGPQFDISELISGLIADTRSVSTKQPVLTPLALQGHRGLEQCMWRFIFAKSGTSSVY